MPSLEGIFFGAGERELEQLAWPKKPGDESRPSIESASVATVVSER